MKSLNSRFLRVQKSNPSRADFICLSKAVRDQKFKRPALLKALQELVPKDDYDRSDRFKLINHLWKSSNPVEDNEIDPESA
jgi:predicted RNA-binding protein YlxR (DUF448 family)